MTDKDLKLEGIREEILVPLQTFAEKLREQTGENLQSITVVGSSLTEDFRPGQSDINTVLVLKKQVFDSLKAIASMAKSMSKNKLSAPLLMTTSYIEQSRDVFGIEFLDLQLTHRTILGEDPFAELSFGKKDVRLQCERELKATLIRLRQGYIASAGNKKLVGDILISAVKGLAGLLRAMLWLKDAERPVTDVEALRKAGEEFGLPAEMLVEVRGWRHRKARIDDSQVRVGFESVYTIVEQLANIVDKLEV